MRSALALALLAVLLAGQRVAGQTPPPAAAPIPASPATLTSARVVLFAPVGPGGAGELRFRAGTSAPVPATTVDEGRYVHQVVTLGPGRNTLALVRGDSVLRSWELWYASAGSDAAPAPAGVPRYRLHAAALGECGRCHGGRWSTPPGSSVRLDSLACFGCHREFDRAGVRHGPAAGWACLACHEPTGMGALMELPVRIGPRCLSCHSDLAGRMAAAPVGHGPAVGGFCATCHDPHGSAEQRLLRRPVDALCGSCHPEQSDGRHVSGWSGSARAHPVAGRPDPRRPGRELSCTSCHEPHAAGVRFLFREAATLEELCQGCHSGPRAPSR